MVVLGAVLTDVDHMTTQHRQTTYKALNIVKERVTLVTRQNMVWGREFFTQPVAYPGILFGGGGLTNSVEDRGQRERGSVG